MLMVALSLVLLVVGALAVGLAKRRSGEDVAASSHSNAGPRQKPQQMLGFLCI